MASKARYALYNGYELIAEGSIKDIARITNTKRSTVEDCKRVKGNKVLIRIDEDDDLNYKTER